MIPRKTTATIKSLKEKIRLNNFLVKKADKGNTVVVMNRTDYNAKMLQFF